MNKSLAKLGRFIAAFVEADFALGNVLPRRM